MHRTSYFIVAGGYVYGTDFLPVRNWFGSLGPARRRYRVAVLQEVLRPAPERPMFVVLAEFVTDRAYQSVGDDELRELARSSRILPYGLVRVHACQPAPGDLHQCDRIRLERPLVESGPTALTAHQMCATKNSDVTPVWIPPAALPGADGPTRHLL